LFAARARGRFVGVLGGCAAESASFSLVDARLIFADFKNLFGGKKRTANGDR
jgi:hypothetical protein